MHRLFTQYGVTVWQTIFTILAFFVAVATGWWAWDQRQTHGLQVVTLTRSSLVSVAQSIADQVEVRYQGKPVENLYLVETKLENTGNQPIRSADYENPVTFVFPEGTEVVGAQVIDSRLVASSPKLSFSANHVEMEPLMLNPTARLVLQFLVIGGDSLQAPISYTVKASIANILDTTPIEAVDTQPQSQLSALMTWMGVMLGAVTVIGLLTGVALQFTSRVREVREVQDLEE